MQKAAKGGFNINGAENGIQLGNSVHFGSHPSYSSGIQTQLDDISRLNPNLSDRDAALLLNHLVDTQKDALAQQVTKLK